MSDSYREALARLTHTCVKHGGRFNPAVCDRRRDPHHRKNLLFENPDLLYTLAECVDCSGPVPIDSMAPIDVIPKRSLPDITGIVPEPRRHKCQECGETDPALFHAGQYGRCKRCYNAGQAAMQRKRRTMKSSHTISPGFRRQSIYLCQYCGDTATNNFYGTMRSTCKKCHNKRMNELAKAKRAANDIPKRKTAWKPFLCKVCGETDPARFMRGDKSYCRTCKNLRDTERKRARREMEKQS